MRPYWFKYNGHVKLLSQALFWSPWDSLEGFEQQHTLVRPKLYLPQSCKQSLNKWVIKDSYLYNYICEIDIIVEVKLENMTDFYQLFLSSLPKQDFL